MTTEYYNDNVKRCFTEFCAAYSDVTPAGAVQFAKNHRFALTLGVGAPFPFESVLSASQTLSLIALAHSKIETLLKELEAQNPSPE